MNNKTLSVCLLLIACFFFGISIGHSWWWWIFGILCGVIGIILLYNEGEE